MEILQKKHKLEKFILFLYKILSAWHQLVSYTNII
jgi:hypothetical protein